MVRYYINKVGSSTGGFTDESYEWVHRWFLELSGSRDAFPKGSIDIYECVAVLMQYNTIIICNTVSKLVSSHQKTIYLLNMYG